MEKNTPVRKPHTSTADLLTWSETTAVDSPATVRSAARSHQPSDGISKVVFGGQVTDEEVESLNKRRSIFQERVEPSPLSSSLYYGGQEDMYVCSASNSTSQSYSKNKKVDGKDDSNHLHSASRGNWWQGLFLFIVVLMRDGRTEITTDDLLQAAQIEEQGMLDKKERSPEIWKQVAINEAAMAVVATNFNDFKNIEFINIAPRAGRELGYVRVKMDHIKFKEGLLSRQSLLDHITVQLAPRAADEIWHGEGQLSTIWAETADNARSAARTFVLGVSNFWVADRINVLICYFFMLVTN